MAASDAFERLRSAGVRVCASPPSNYCSAPGPRQFSTGKQKVMRPFNGFIGARLLCEIFRLVRCQHGGFCICKHEGMMCAQTACHEAIHVPAHCIIILLTFSWHSSGIPPQRTVRQTPGPWCPPPGQPASPHPPPNPWPCPRACLQRLSRQHCRLHVVQTMRMRRTGCAAERAGAPRRP